MATSPKTSVQGTLGLAVGEGFGAFHGANRIELSAVRLRLRRGHDSDQRGVRSSGAGLGSLGEAGAQPTAMKKTQP